MNCFGRRLMCLESLLIETFVDQKNNTICNSGDYNVQCIYNCWYIAKTIGDDN